MTVDFRKTHLRLNRVHDISDKEEVLICIHLKCNMQSKLKKNLELEIKTSRAGVIHLSPDSILSRNLGADSICIAIFKYCDSTSIAIY